MALSGGVLWLQSQDDLGSSILGAGGGGWLGWAVVVGYGWFCVCLWGGGGILGLPWFNCPSACCMGSLALLGQGSCLPWARDSVCIGEGAGAHRLWSLGVSWGLSYGSLLPVVQCCLATITGGGRLGQRECVSVSMCAYVYVYMRMGMSVRMYVGVCMTMCEGRCISE